MKKIILVSKEINKEVENMLGEYGELRKLPSFSRLPSPVASHRDMLCFFDKTEGKVYLPKEYVHLNPEIFDGIEIECVDEIFGERYPEDIYLDALCVGDVIICKESATAKRIKACKKVINVNQGYAACSVCLLKNAAITADEGIKKALEDLGLRVLQISPGGIELSGYSYGFIGGASFVTDERVFFFGDVSCHHDGDKIINFIKAEGYRVEYIKGMPLTDYGSALELKVR